MHALVRSQLSAARSRRRRLVVVAAAAFAAAWLAPPCAAAIELRSPLLDDPRFDPAPEAVALPEGTLRLWCDALGEPDDESRREACLALIRAHRLGIPVRDAATEPLARLLSTADASPAALRAAVAAARALALRELAAHVEAALQLPDADLQRLGETALAEWQWQPLADRWRSRLDDPRASRQQRLWAYRGLGSVQDAASAPPLAARVLDPAVDFAERLAAAEALARIPAPARDAVAAQLAAGEGAQRRLAAVVVAQSSDPAAQRLREQLALDPDATVAASALESLLRHNPAAGLAGAFRWQRAASVRLRGLALAMFRAAPDPKTVAALAAALDDPHPLLRREAGDALVELASNPPLRAAVARGVAAELKQPRSSPALYQAVCVAGAAGYPNAAPRLLPLLEHPDPQVAVAAAWALARIAPPETAPALLARLRAVTERTESIRAELAAQYAAAPPDGEVPVPDLTDAYRQAESLIVALGRLRHQSAASELLRYLPKPSPQGRGEPPHVETYCQSTSRAAALWALGKLHEGSSPQPSPELLAELAARMTDTTPIPAEDPWVRQMAAVSLARMDRREFVPQFREFFDPDATPLQVGRGCGWALERLGESLPATPRRPPPPRRDWFLTPMATR
jgi:HEAT repeat protein